MRNSCALGAVIFLAVGGMGALACTSCLAEGTLVTTPAGAVGIETLQVGDEVLAVDPVTRATHVRKVKAVARHELRETFVIDAGSSHLRVTDEHKIWVSSKSVWLQAGDLAIGDRLLVLDGTEIRERIVEGIRRDGACVTVFDISLEGSERAFFADGVLVHNKEPVCSAAECGPPSRIPAEASVGDAAGDAAGDAGATDAANDAAADVGTDTGSGDAAPDVTDASATD